MLAQNFLMFLGMLSILVIVLISAFFTTRWIGIRMGSVSGMGVNGQKLALLYRMPLGRDQQLAVVKVANRHVVIGCTPHQLTYITELTKDESEEFFSQTEVGDAWNPSFSDVLQQLRVKSKQDAGKIEESE